MPNTKSGGGNAGPPEHGHEVFMAWTNITTWHGMYDLFATTNRLSRILWIIVVVFTTYMFMLQVTQLVLDFVTGDKWGASSYDVSPNKTDTNKEPNGIDFPNITICNFNLVSETKMRQLKMNPQLVEYIMEGMAPFSNEMKWIPDNETRESFEPVMRKEYYDLVGDVYTDGREWLRRLSPSCEETIKACSMGKGRTVNGMTIHLDPDLDNYAPLNLQTNQDAGFLLSLAYEPEYSTVSTPIVLRPGSHSWLAIQAIEEKTTFFGNGRHILYDILARGNPLSPFDATVPCDPKAKLSVLSGPYLYETCIEDCVTQQIVKMCGCAPLNPTLPNFTICDPPTSQGCAANFWLNETAETAALHAEAGRCIETCSQPCARRYVTARNSATLWPAPKHVKTVQKQLAVSEGSMPSEDNVKNRVLVDIFFESTMIHVTEMSEQRTIVGLVSNIGGNLGVWAGISIVTVYQLIVCLTNIIIVTIKKRVKEMHKLGKKVASSSAIRRVTTMGVISRAA